MGRLKTGKKQTVSERNSLENAAAILTFLLVVLNVVRIEFLLVEESVDTFHGNASLLAEKLGNCAELVVPGYGVCYFVHSL